MLFGTPWYPKYLGAGAGVGAGGVGVGVGVGGASPTYLGFWKRHSNRQTNCPARLESPFPLYSNQNWSADVVMKSFPLMKGAGKTFLAFLLTGKLVILEPVVVWEQDVSTSSAIAPGVASEEHELY